MHCDLMGAARLLDFTRVPRAHFMSGGCSFIFKVLGCTYGLQQRFGRHAIIYYNPNIHDLLMLVDMTPPTCLKNVYNQKQMSKDQYPTFPTTQPEAIPGPVPAFTCFYFHLVIRHGSELIWLWPGHVPGQLNHILRGAKVSFGGRC